jgi:hypothetical protein
MKFDSIAIVVSICLSLLACSDKERVGSPIKAQSGDQLYSAVGQEKAVSFSALYLTTYTSLDEYKEAVNPVSKRQVLNLVMFLFGPLTHREIAGVHRPEEVTIDTLNPVVDGNKVYVRFSYSSRWLIHQSVLEKGELIVPLPYNTEIVYTIYTKGWKRCTDTYPSHQTQSMLWYYWDPSRYGCDHQLGLEYQNVLVEMGASQEQTILSYPEYKEMIRNQDEKKTLSMTFAFGYVEDQANPNPYTDSDSGMQEFQSYIQTTDQTLAPLGFLNEPILASSYQKNSDLQIGTKWVGEIGGVKIVVKVVSTAGIDQMDLFAKSYAQEHDSFFGWFGHSRVGSGFDAEQFRKKLLYQPDLYTLSESYQMIYWAGCNSYSYYTTPFFEMKAQLNPALDPNGTKKLDIISNALPSYFAFNAVNAQVMLNALLGFQNPQSYQQIITELESQGSGWGVPVIVNVIGDEDNK